MRTQTWRNERVILRRILQDDFTDELGRLAGGIKKNSLLIQDALKDSHKVSAPHFNSCDVGYTNISMLVILCYCIIHID